MKGWIALGDEACIGTHLVGMATPVLSYETLLAKHDGDYAWPVLDALIEQRDPYCRGVVILGLNAPIGELARGFADAARSRNCRGFAVGRTIFGEPARAWLSKELDDAGLVASVRANFEALIDAWQAAKAENRK